MLQFLKLSKFIPLALEIITAITKIIDAIKERQAAEAKKKQAILKNQQTSIEDKDIAKADAIKKKAVDQLISIAHDFLPADKQVSMTIQELSVFSLKLENAALAIVEAIEAGMALLK